MKSSRAFNDTRCLALFQPAPFLGYATTPETGIQHTDTHKRQNEGCYVSSLKMNY